MKKIYILLITVLLFLSISRIYGVPTPSVWHTISQPDGTQLTIQVRGDEFFHYIVSSEGYLLLRNNNGVYHYAQLSEDNTLVSTGIKAQDISQRTDGETSFLSTLPTAEEVGEKLAQIHTQKAILRKASQITATKHPISGNVKSLVILVEYTDVGFVTSNIKQAFTNMLNKQGYSDNGGTGSAGDYFRDNSMGTFAPEFVVVGPYSLPNARAYYGSNYPYDDAKVSQMIVDACQLASADIDFSQFDNDGNGIVDNVTVFYAGHNEAETNDNLPNSVWPHRWWIDEGTYGRKVYIQGLQIYDYLCTSELRGSKGSEMCGIGTFVHEFSHVLGLPDYYPTTGSNHQTLSDWDVMDVGSYLNKGRTPPAYSAYDRFYLGWLTPTELLGSQDVTLQPLPQSNKAYIITKDGNHNLDGANPSPTQFFTLENRQQTGWDTYLPGHGLLITRINYNKSDWEANTVNKLPGRAGVKIMEADRKTSESSLAGDPFPGTSNVTYYIPELSDGTFIENKRIHIKEESGIIHLQYLESDGVAIPFALEPLNITAEGFTANWKKTGNADAYRISIYNVMEGSSTITKTFDNGLTDVYDWHSSTGEVIHDAALCGETAPAAALNKTGDFIQTEQFLFPAVKLSFHLKARSQAYIQFVVKGWNGTDWIQIKRLNTSTQNDALQQITLSEESNYTRFRFEVLQADDLVAIDDITITLSKQINYAWKEALLSNADTTFEVTSAYPDLDYYYVLRASRTVEGKETVSSLSNRILVHTSQADKNNKIQLLSASDGKMLLYISSEYIGRPLYLTSVSGRLIKQITAIPYNFVEINGLPSQQIYMVKVEKSHIKILMP